MWLWLKRLFLTFMFTGLIVTNVLTLTSAAFNAALSGLVSTAFGVVTVTEALQARIARQQLAGQQRKAAARRFGTRLAARTRRVAAASIAALPGEMLPVVGVSILIAGTAYELYEACESLRDLDELYRGLGLEDEVPDEVLSAVCEVELIPWGEQN